MEQLAESTRTRVPIRAVLLGLAVVLVAAGAIFDRGNCTRREEVQLFALGAAACLAVAIGLGGTRRRWIVAVATGALSYAVLWLEWAVNAEHCLN